MCPYRSWHIHGPPHKTNSTQNPLDMIKSESFSFYTITSVYELEAKVSLLGLDRHVRPCPILSLPRLHHPSTRPGRLVSLSISFQSYHLVVLQVLSAATRQAGSTYLLYLVLVSDRPHFHTFRSFRYLVACLERRLESTTKMFANKRLSKVCSLHFEGLILLLRFSFTNVHLTISRSSSRY